MAGVKAPAEYRLAFVPDDTSFTVRENLVNVLERELLGPVNGPDELLPISPRAMYLVGHIAPVKLSEDRINLEAVEDGEELIEIRGDDAGSIGGRGRDLTKVAVV